MRSLYVATDSVYGAREKGIKRLLDLMLEQLDRRYLFFFLIAGNYEVDFGPLDEVPL